MEKTTIMKTGKLISITVMLLTGIATIITSMNGYLSDKDYGVMIIALGAFLISVRNYLKDHYGMI
jgi:hypothetical protein